jgi:glutathione S-transferase
MTAIKIHGVPPSTFTRTVRLACHEKGIDYELVPTMPGEITALNPFRKIPAVSHGDLVLFETTAILRYLDRTFAGPKLWPDDSIGIALCDQWVSAVCDSLVNAALRYMASRYGFLPVPAEIQRQYLDKTREVMPIVSSARPAILRAMA